MVSDPLKYLPRILPPPITIYVVTSFLWPDVSRWVRVAVALLSLPAVIASVVLQDRYWAVSTEPVGTQLDAALDKGPDARAPKR
ncbi:hypothetical protein PLICRDRAFT_174632 [Plicaturopsis crispa FD-325 SS-3]|nr:hypothetical protein PLICRDRAFT_174632 [Plicaturopsis crispa FD-325 SS-3]